MAGVESGQAADADAAARQAAEVAVELSEAEGPEDKKRITRALQYVAGRGADAVRRGSGVARRGAGNATGTVTRTAGGAQGRRLGRTRRHLGPELAHRAGGGDGPPPADPRPG